MTVFQRPHRLMPRHLCVPACTVIAVSAAVLAAPAVAADAEGPPPQELSTVIERHLLAQAPAPQAVIEEVQAFAAHEMEGERLVKGAPYCADAVHESVQLLPEAGGGIGNRIVRKQTSRLCRDGEGRTRQEVERDGKRRVYLRDPVAKENWVLDPEARTARRLGTPMTVSMSMNLPPVLHDSGVWRDYADRMREWARNLADRARAGGTWNPPAMPPVPGTPGAAGTAPAAPTPPAAPMPPAPPSPVVIAPTPGAGENHEIKLRILRADADAVAPLPPLPPGMSSRAGHLAPRGPGVTTALPAKEIDGVRVNGERTTWTIEAGKLGNEKPIVITREVWRSPDLLLTVQSNDFDPRSGQTAYRLVNLKRGEPDAALMKVPSDYDQKGRAPTPKPASAPKAKA